MNITMRRAVGRVSDIDAGAAVIATVALACIATVAAATGAIVDVPEVWPLILLGAFVPGLSQLLVVRAVEAAGASRAGILFGMAPLFSALIAVSVFGEPLRWPLAVGTLLVVAGGASLAWESQRPGDYRALGAVLALTVAVGFGIRDNVARSVGGHVTASALAQATAIMLGAATFLVLNFLRQRSVLPRVRTAFRPYAPTGVVTAGAQATLFEALDRGRVTAVAPLVGTGVLWTVVFAAMFLGRSEPVGRRLVTVALLVVAGSALVGATR